jgi:surface polysaccharide O-acyltransferase-like enzyme
MTKDEYKKEFDGESKKEKALEYALDIRKFEIELYWKRATYFWTFIAAALAGYAVIQRISDEHSKGELSLLLVCLGVIFSLAWYLVNRGSKFW